MCCATAIHAQVPLLNSHPSSPAAIFLDFDGHTLEGSSWNSTGPIICNPSGLNDTQITEAFNRIAEDYRPFNLNITTDSAKYFAAPVNRRMRIIMTTTWEWWGAAGGVAFIGSFIWGDDTPGFVFTSLHGYNVKNIAEAASHEAGHTLGLFHQSKYDASCNKLSEYYSGQGTGEIGWAPIMGVGYSRNFTLWHNGPNAYGCTNYQNDLEIITSPDNGFGYRTDDHGSSFATATQPTFTAQQFNMEGVIERNTDQDLFRFIMPGTGRFELNAIPYNVGTGNAGSDLDMQVTLYDDTENILSIYNPGTLLSSLADTVLDAGTYYLKVEGKGNLNAPAYASLGSYSLLSRIEDNNTVLALRKLELRGTQNGDMHQFNWIVDADEKIDEQVLEVSADGRKYTELTTAAKDDRSYIYRPSSFTNTLYRLRVTFDNGRRNYSNTIAIRENELTKRPKLVSNLINSSTITISSPGNYSYNIVNFNGMIIKTGRLNSGINSIVIEQLKTGIYFVRFTNNKEQWTDKLLRQ
jgi:hypothetical protein